MSLNIFLNYSKQKALLSYSRLHTSEERDSSAKPPKDTECIRILNCWGK